jgi:hypothetical protein
LRCWFETESGFELVSAHLLLIYQPDYAVHFHQITSTPHHQAETESTEGRNKRKSMAARQQAYVRAVKVLSAASSRSKLFRSYLESGYDHGERPLFNTMVRLAKCI